MNALVSEWTRQYSANRVMELMQNAGVGAGVVKAPNEIYADPQLQHRRHFRSLKHEEIGDYNIEMPAFRLSETPGEIERAAPCLGQDNEYVYTKILGISDEEFIELLTEGVFD